MRSARSSTTTSWPARVSCWADGQPGRTRTDHDDAFAGLDARQLRLDPALVPRPVDDLHLDLLDGHRVGVDAEHACCLARRRAQPAGELGEVVGGMQAIDRVSPVLAIDQVVPVRDQVAERAAVVAERDTAIHATSGLDLHLVEREVVVDLLPITESNRHLATRGHLRVATSGIQSCHPRAASMIRSKVCCSSRPSASACLITPRTRL